MELTFVLNTSELKAAGFEGSFNQFADELAEMDCIVSGTYDEDGTPVITIVGISEEELADKLADYGVEDASQFTTPVDPEDVGEQDLDTDANGEVVDIDQDENDDQDETIDDDEEIEIEEDVPEEEDEDDLLPGTDDDPLKGIMDDEDDVLDDENYIDDDEEDEIAETASIKEFKGTKNISESLMTTILSNVKDKYLTARISNRMKVLKEMKAAEAEEAKRLNENKKPVTIYLNSWSNNKVNGVEIWKYRNLDIIDLLAESKKSYKTVYKKYKSLNESNTKRKDYVKVLRKQRALIEMLESEYRFRNINEDDLPQQGQDLDTTDAEQNDTQEATLTSIVFKVKNADEFIKVLTDHGIPAEALKKGSTIPDDGSDGTQQDDQTQQDAAAPAAPATDAMVGAPAPAAPAPGANPFESVTTPLTKKNKLNEDGNPFDQLANPEGQGETNLGDPDQPAPTDGVDPLNTDEAADAGEGEEVILTDTSYASQVQKVLEDVYGYAKKDFEDKIGGELVDADGSENDEETAEENPFDSMDGSDGSDNGLESDEDDDKVGTEDTISPADLFGDL